MSKLFGRVAILKLGDLQIGTETGKALSFAFEVKADGKGTPNTAEIKVYNLAPSSRKSLEAKKLPAQLIAGYQESSGQIFKGEIRNAYSARVGADIETTISAGDGERAIQSARVAVTLAPGQTAASVLEAAATALGAGEGNLAEVLVKLAGKPTLFPKGGALFGSAFDQLQRIANAYGYRASIQGGNLLFLEDAATRQTAEVFSEATGLIGSPKVDTKGKVSFEALLRHGVAIGDAVKLDAEFVKGVYRVVEYSHKGNTTGVDAWTTSIVCDSKV